MLDVRVPQGRGACAGAPLPACTHVRHAAHARCTHLPAGVGHLYVHVVADNTPARELYCSRCGFEVEAEESESYARMLQRPRRMLLGKQLAK